MKKICLLALLLALLTSGVSRAMEMNIAYVDFPPYEYQENGEPAGIQVDIVKEIFKKAGITLKLQFLPFPRALNYVKSGNIDGLFNFYKTDERVAHFDYSDPIITNPLVFFVRRDSLFEYRNLDSLKGLKVGAMIGYTYGPEFDNSTAFSIDRVSSHEANFKMLVTGRIDAYPCDKMVGIYTAEKAGFLKDIKVLDTPLKVMDGYIGFTKGRHTGEIQLINKAISTMKNEKEIDKIQNAFLEKIKK